MRPAVRGRAGDQGSRRRAPVAPRPRDLTRFLSTSPLRSRGGGSAGGRVRTRAPGCLRVRTAMPNTPMRRLMYMCCEASATAGERETSATSGECEASATAAEAVDGQLETPVGVRVRGPINGERTSILTRDALAFLADLARTFRPRIEECLAARAEVRAALPPDGGRGHRRDFARADLAVGPPPRRAEQRRDRHRRLRRPARRRGDAQDRARDRACTGADRSLPGGQAHLPARCDRGAARRVSHPP